MSIVNSFNILKRQGQIVAATLNNFEAVEKALANMENSTGSADREMSVIMDSIEYRLNALKETWTGVSQNLFARDDMKTGISILQQFSNAIEGLTGKLGLFKTMALSFGAFMGAKNFGICI